MKNSQEDTIRKKIRQITRKTPSTKREEIRKALWPDIIENDLWLRKKDVGFTTIPRTITLVSRIMDQLAGKGKPVSSTYLALWCWVFDEGFVEIKDPSMLAFESGFSGNRAHHTWKARMKILEELGFIKSKPGFSNDYQYIIILNPIKVIKKIYEGKPHDHAYNAFVSRAIQVGELNVTD